MSHIEEGRLHAYLDGQLPARERSEVEAHVAACAECRARLGAAEELVRASHAILGQVDPGPGQPAPWPEIEARGAARSGRPRRGVWLEPRLAWAATIALAFAVGWLARDVQAPSGVGDVSLTQPIVQETATPVEPSVPSEAAKTATPRSQQERAEPERDRGAAAPARMAEQVDDTPQPTAGRAAEPAAETPAPAAEQREVRRRSEEEARRRAEDEARRRAEVARQDQGERAYAAPMALRQQADSLALGAGGALDEITVQALRVEGATTAEDATFVPIEPSAAATWLGAPPRTLPGLSLERVDVGPGSAVRGGLSGLPVVRLVYRDDAGRAVTLLQQRVERELAARDTSPTLVVPPSGPKAYRWTDGDIVLTLSAELAADSLRALAARVR